MGRALTRGASSLEEPGTAVIGTLPTAPPPDDVTLLLARGL
ncbi:SpoIIE family protein phosphatase OS=Streptomyces tendae OX=1932 GN=GUR47_06130 PE=4 SV=1 [Streptomyces tendae]